jgi:hypothetical protein
MTIRTLLALATLLLFTAGLAHADIAPPPGYKESCRIPKVRQPGEECVSCGDAYHGDVEACKRKLEPEGYAYRCQTQGASTWDEVWCRPAGADAGASAGEGAADAEASADGGADEALVEAADAEASAEGEEAEEPVTTKGCSVAAGAVGSPVIALLLGWLVARRRG